MGQHTVEGQRSRVDRRLVHRTVHRAEAADFGTNQERSRPRGNGRRRCGWTSRQRTVKVASQVCPVVCEDKVVPASCERWEENFGIATGGVAAKDYIPRVRRDNVTFVREPTLEDAPERRVGGVVDPRL